MISRYTAMSPSIEVDADKEFYPDPLSINYDDLISSEGNTPSKYAIDTLTLQKPFILTAVVYNKTFSIYDDIILSWNDVPHISTLDVDDVLYFPTEVDIKTFIYS